MNKQGPKTKKILIVLTSLRAEGTPVLVLELCRRWIAYGIEPRVVTLYPEPDDLGPEFQKLGVRIECLAVADHGYLRYVKMFWGSYRISREFKPDALLSMPLGRHTFFSYGAKLAGVAKIAAHVGNCPTDILNKSFQKFRWLVQMGRPVVDVLICCSDYVRENVMKCFGVTSSETVTIYNGCAVDKVADRAEFARRKKMNGKIIIGMVASLELHKDQPTLIHAARLLKAQGIGFEVWLVGEGSRRSEYQSLISELMLSDYVKLLGMRRDVPELLGQMDIFVFSAKPDEGLGVALIEAMAAGVPVVASHVGACREVLEEGLLGLLIPSQDPQEMAGAILSTINDPVAARFRAQQAKEKVSRVFTIEGMEKEYAACLGLSHDV